MEVNLSHRFTLFIQKITILIVIGDHMHISPLERSYKGKVLAHYPENVTTNPFDDSAVCMVSKINLFI